MSARRRVVVTLGLTQTLAWGSTYYLPAILAEPMARDLGVSTGNVFGAFSLALILTAILGPPAGHRIDTHGGRGVLASSSLLFAAGLLSLALAQGPVSLWCAWAIIGVGMAVGLYDAAFATLTALYGHQARRAIAGITLMAGFASTVCWPITGWLEAEFGWRTACIIWGAAHLLIGLPLNRVLLPGGIRAATPHSIAPPARAASVRFAMPLLALVFAITWILSTAMAAHLPRLLQEAGHTATTAIALAALVGPAQVAARFLEFSLLRRFHPLVSARLASAAHPLGAMAMLLFGAPAAALFTLLHGAGNGILTIAKGTLPLAIFGPRGYGRRQGWLMAPARFGQAFSPFLFALLIERLGSGALAVSAALGLVALGALTLLHYLMRQALATDLPQGAQ
ncbi:MFS transporter [Alcanivorax sp. JB21]|uniref:MFS transporter n=1 Tax=Alcanivorax limicola TaxID=2874102 RepID=UPI001CBF3799|nr:MFS transporter [Alcanivorax limicola]MBZ2188851.1 MFS transporter [Alcanivorax limicola]